MQKNGFTLLELLVVIAIIGILSTIAVVNLNSSRKKAKEAELLAIMGQTQKAAILCMYNNRDLRCGGTTCIGNQINTPVAGQPMCTGSENNWPVFDNPDIIWGVTNSLSSELQFCFEASWQDPNIFLAGGGIYSRQYYCTNETCHTQSTAGSPCSISGCQDLGETCDAFNICCGSYNCNGGVCTMPEISG